MTPAQQYKQARKDFDELYAFRETENQLSIDDQFMDLMREPTKKKALSLYEGLLQLWFDERRKRGGDLGTFNPGQIKRMRLIADRHNIVNF